MLDHTGEDSCICPGWMEAVEEAPAFVQVVHLLTATAATAGSGRAPSTTGFRTGHGPGSTKTVTPRSSTILANGTEGLTMMK